MEHQHYHNQQHEDNNGNGGGGNGRSSILCRQSSTRWIPTTDQIRILKDLYYNSGLRSPNGDQIQRISARLRQYGKIEGKNVFYWFQNHKARERQKKRLTVDVNASNKLNNMSLAGTSPSSAVYDIGHMGSTAAGSLLMERAYRECALPGGVGVEGNMGWVGVETATMPPQLYYHQQRTAAATYYQEAGYYHNHLHHETQQLQHQEGEEEAGMETLPLFPTRSEAGEQDEEGHVNSCMQPYSLGTINAFHRHLLPNDNNCSDIDASLELSLNSYRAPRGSM